MSRGRPLSASVEWVCMLFWILEVEVVAWAWCAVILAGTAAGRAGQYECNPLRSRVAGRHACGL
ncbi:hypothetical protein C5614_07155 [Massilia phosphatilytica]|nr:hypothetical protein C5614_07155 [Massilia phosphatilytica]